MKLALFLAALTVTIICLASTWESNSMELCQVRNSYDTCFYKMMR